MGGWQRTPSWGHRVGDQCFCFLPMGGTTSSQGPSIPPVPMPGWRRGCKRGKRGAASWNLVDLFQSLPSMWHKALDTSRCYATAWNQNTDVRDFNWQQESVSGMLWKDGRILCHQIPPPRIGIYLGKGEVTPHPSSPQRQPMVCEDGPQHVWGFIPFFLQPLRFVLVFPRASSGSLHFVDNTKLGSWEVIQQDGG